MFFCFIFATSFQLFQIEKKEMSKVVKRRVLGRSPKQRRMVDFFSNPETRASKESTLSQAEKKITKPVATVLVVRCVLC